MTDWNYRTDAYGPYAEKAGILDGPCRRLGWIYGMKTIQIAHQYEHSLRQPPVSRGIFLYLFPKGFQES